MAIESSIVFGRLNMHRIENISGHVKFKRQSGGGGGAKRVREREKEKREERMESGN